ncbi:mannitol-1-phosphate 5-dehydrogenase [Enterococcus ratti]|uniref:mannitol-1-phosphate 5-dehydrogenase n=1 Tax=Enterococcus ratti TaxID=150033 RepID=UPI003515A334
MKAVHFGAGNIGRGFIGEVLAENEFALTFIDVNDQLISELNDKKSYTIELEDDNKKQILVENVCGINNQKNPEQVVQAIAKADIVTTAIGPKILPFIANLIADGIQLREKAGNKNFLDIIACENMIGGSSFLEKEVRKYLKSTDFLESYIGFPNAAVDRIVPQQTHVDPLFVQVEPFKEWVIEEPKRKNKKINLKGVLYVEDLEPYIERKLFSVNTGHATVAYTGALLGYQTIDEAMQDSLVVAQLKAVLHETGSLLVTKWGFDTKKHEIYIEKIIQRFQNKHISDAISRVARTPLRKLGYQERFTRPVRELQKYHLEYYHLIATMGIIFNYYDPNDEESCQLQEMRTKENLKQLIQKVTGIKDPVLIEDIKNNVVRYEKNVA